MPQTSETQRAHGLVCEHSRTCGSWARGPQCGVGNFSLGPGLPSPHPRGLTTALLQKGSQQEGRCWEWTIPA